LKYAKIAFVLGIEILPNGGLLDNDATLAVINIIQLMAVRFKLLRQKMVRKFQVLVVPLVYV